MELDFSIIIPIYNVEEYLSDCVNSVLRQNYHNYEVILVNDGSTDNCPQICNNYAIKYPDKIKVIHKKNGGLSDARNTGLRVAKGKYTIFLDGDDYFSYSFLSEFSSLIKLDVDIILGAGLICDFGNYRKTIIRNWNGLPTNSKLNHDSDKILTYLLNSASFQWSAWANIYKTSFLICEKLFFKKNITCEDAEWTPKVILKGTSFGISDVIFYGYRINREGSIMGGLSFKRWLDYVQITEEWITIANEWNNKVLSEKLKRLYINGCFKGLTEVSRFNADEKNKAIEIVLKSQFIKSPFKKEHIRLKSLINLIGIRKVLIFLKIRYILKKRGSILKQSFKRSFITTSNK